MPENLKKLLRDVFSVDTEAGYRMRYHITRALACEDYAREINFNLPANLVSEVFFWDRTPEDNEYWAFIQTLTNSRE